MTTILKSAPVVEKHLANLTEKCSALKEKGIIPYMKVILVGDNPASIIYTRNKKKFCEKFGAKCDIIKLEADLSEADFLKEISNITNDDLVHGCFVQLPLPKQLQHIDVGQLIPPKKDVDGFHAYNIYEMYKGDKGENALIPCTPKGIIHLCDFYNIDLQKKDVVVIGRSQIVGKPMSMLLTNHNATVTLCHSKTKDLKEHTQKADIIISAVGNPKYFNSSYVNPQKKQILIDVGINHDENKKMCGDMDFDDVFDTVNAITPVPGGVGPMTILSLAQNLLQAAQNSIN